MTGNLGSEQLQVVPTWVDWGVKLGNRAAEAPRNVTNVLEQGSTSLTPSVRPGTNDHPRHVFHSITVYHVREHVLF